MNRLNKSVVFKGESLDKLSKHLKYLYTHNVLYTVTSRGVKENFEVVVSW